MTGARTALPLVPLALALALPLPLPARASGTYSWFDEDGVLHVTNVPPGQGAPIRSARARPGPARPARAAAAYDGLICAAAGRHRLAPALVKAVIAVESSFDPGAVSPKGAAGLMQLMPATARDLEVGAVHDPAENIAGGTRYLRQLHDRFAGDLRKVLAAYNAGPEAVRRAGDALPPFAETRTYVQRVLAARDRYARADWCGGGQALAMR